LASIYLFGPKGQKEHLQKMKKEITLLLKKMVIIARRSNGSSNVHLEDVY